MPPSDKPTDRAGAFLRHTRLICLIASRVCGTSWLGFLAWIAWTQPDRLGPTRMIGVIALGSVTATSTVLWWLSTLKLRERMDAAVNAARQAETGSVGGPVGVNGRLHHLGDTARK